VKKKKKAKTRGGKRKRKGGSGHKQVRVSWGRRSALVDEAIAPLIEALWRAGLETVNSCADNRSGTIRVQFGTAADASSFLRKVGKYEEGTGTLYHRLKPHWRPPDGGARSAPDWEYQAIPEDAARTWQEDREGGPGRWHGEGGDFYFSMSVQFPWIDLPVVLERLTSHNQAYARRPW
jgi:hypothetical protein